MNCNQRIKGIPGELTTGRKPDQSLVISGSMIDQSYSRGIIAMGITERKKREKEQRKGETFQHPVDASGFLIQ